MILFVADRQHQQTFLISTVGTTIFYFFWWALRISVHIKNTKQKNKKVHGMEPEFTKKKKITRFRKELCKNVDMR